MWCLYQLADPGAAIEAEIVGRGVDEAVRAYCRRNLIPEERAESVEVPLWLTKRGVLVRAVKR